MTVNLAPQMTVILYYNDRYFVQNDPYFSFFEQRYF